MGKSLSQARYWQTRLHEYKLYPANINKAWCVASWKTPTLTAFDLSVKLIKLIN